MRGEDEDFVGWSPRVVPVTMASRHTPSSWKAVSDEICESMRVRRSTTPFESWDEHRIYGPYVKHYMNFNQVPTPMTLRKAIHSPRNKFACAAISRQRKRMTAALTATTLINGLKVR